MRLAIKGCVIALLTSVVGPAQAGEKKAMNTFSSKGWSKATVDQSQRVEQILKSSEIGWFQENHQTDLIQIDWRKGLKAPQAFEQHFSGNESWAAACTRTQCTTEVRVKKTKALPFVLMK